MAIVDLPQIIIFDVFGGILLDSGCHTRRGDCSAGCRAFQQRAIVSPLHLEARSLRKSSTARRLAMFLSRPPAL